MLLQRYSVGCNTISRMGKPPVRILARDRRECFGDGLFQGLPRTCCLRPQERLDLGPTCFDRGQVGRIRRQIEPPDARGGTDVRNTRPLMGFEISHDEDLAWTELRDTHFSQKGEEDRAIGEAFDCHGGDKPLRTQSPQHGDMAPPIARLRRLGSLAPRRTGVKAGHRLMAASFVKKDQGFRSERLDGLLKRGPLPLHLWPLLLGGAKRFFCAAGRVWPMRG
jgi:hypothetical protein